MPRKVGRVRHAHHMQASSPAAMTRPKAPNITDRVTRLVVNTPVMSTEANHSQSV
jgi:hypothetical protein